MLEPTSMEAKSIRQHLSTFSTAQIQAGMEAFSHPPRKRFERMENDSCGCWMTAAYGASDIARTAWLERSNQTFRDFGTMDLMATSVSGAYESYTKWFHGECLRELAERGVTAEPSVVPGLAEVRTV